MNKLLISAITKKGFEEKLSRGEVSQYLVAFIQETKEIWALGIYYPCPYTKKEILDFIKTLMDEDNKIYGVIDTKEEQLTNLISLEFVRATAKERSLEQLINKNYTDLQESKVNKDSTIPIKAVSFIGNLDGLYINKLTDYIKATTVDSIKTTDSLNIALGKLEHKTDIIYNDLFGEDNDKIINKWEEIVDFISSVEEGKDITDEFITRKTDLVITGNKTFEGIGAGLVTINRTSGAIPWVCFKDRNNIVGYLGVSSESIPTFNDTTASHNLLHAGNYSNYALPLTGGILNSGTDTPLFIKGTNHSCIGFKNSEGTTLGYIGAKQNKQPYFYIGNDAFKIWHEGNDGADSGLDADMLDGLLGNRYLHPSKYISNQDFGVPYGIDDEGRSSNNYIFRMTSDDQQTNLPVKYGIMMSINNGAPGMEFATNGPMGYSTELKFRKRWLKNLSSWKTIAFTDSNITGNAATATKLATPVKLWGNDFDGSSDINDGLIINNSKTLRINNVEGEPISLLELNTNNNFVLGYGAANKQYRSYIYGYDLNFHTGNPVKQSMVISTLGYVGIGTNSPRTKLHIEEGNFLIHRETGSPLIKIEKGDLGASFLIDSFKGLYDHNNSKWIIGSTTAGNTLLNCGNVGIGTDSPKSKLDVFGNISINSKLAISDDNNSNYVIFGQGTRDTYVRGNNIHFLASTESNKTVSISSNGNLGINVTHPLYKLHVNGDARLYYLNVENNNEINSYSDPEKTLGQAIHLNYRNAGNVSLVAGGGNVGIGTSSPSSKLDVNGNIGVPFENGIFFKNNENKQQWHIKSITVDGKTGIVIRNELNVFNALTITEPGNIGISTNMPLAKLHVAGTGKFTDNLNIDGIFHILELNSLSATDTGFVIGYGQADAKKHTYLDGDTIMLRYGKHTVGFVLNNSGNITIGNTNLASTNYKLYIDGSLYTNSLSIQSDTKVDNLNADKLDGYEAEDFALKSDIELLLQQLLSLSVLVLNTIS